MYFLLLRVLQISSVMCFLYGGYLWYLEDFAIDWEQLNFDANKGEFKPDGVPFFWIAIFSGATFLWATFELWLKKK